jgi:acyl transferase domain-containing protein
VAKKIVFMYSGQGGQYKNMGLQLYKDNIVFKYWIDRLDVVFQNHTGKSLCELFFNNISEDYGMVKYSHPAIFIYEYAMTQVLLEENLDSDYYIGTSLGEFAAAVFAGVLPYEEALEVIFRQAEILEKYCENGKMISVLSNIAIYKNCWELYSKTEIAAINSENHFTISVRARDFENIVRTLKNNHITYVVLPVDYPFHSSFIDSAEKYCLNDLKTLKLTATEKTMFSSVTGERLTHIPNSYFWNVIRNKIQFTAALKNIVQDDEYIFIDLGTSGTMSTIVKIFFQGNLQVQSYPILTPFGSDIKNLELLLNRLAY